LKKAGKEEDCDIGTLLGGLSPNRRVVVAWGNGVSTLYEAAVYFASLTDEQWMSKDAIRAALFSLEEFGV
jgi:hypothetical protein